MQPESSANTPLDRPSGDAVFQQRRDFDEVYSLVYEELRRLASSIRRSESSETVNTTALVHEAWMKLKASPHLADTTAAHFKAIAAKAMRQVLVDAARTRKSLKRGGEIVFEALDQTNEPIVTWDAKVLSLNAALEQLAQMNARQAQMIEYRFFSGLSVAETASLLNVSESVVARDWRAAKAFLTVTMQGWAA